MQCCHINRPQGGGNQMIMSINGDKAFNKIQYLLITKKNLSKLGIEANSKLGKKTL